MQGSETTQDRQQSPTPKGNSHPPQGTISPTRVLESGNCVSPIPTQVPALHTSDSPATPGSSTSILQQVELFPQDSIVSVEAGANSTCDY